MIGHGNFFSQFVASSAVESILTPHGDVTGRFWGMFRNRLTLNNDPLSTPPAYSVYTTVEVGGVVVYGFRHNNRNVFGPVQYFQYSTWNGSAYSNYQWANTRSAGGGFGGTGTRIGSYAGVTANNNGEKIGPMRSYMHAYFQPSSLGPSSSAMGFGAGTTAASPSAAYFIHPEPIYFLIDREPGQTVSVRSVLYREVPLSTLSEPINDDPPASGQTIEPDEVEYSTSLYVDAWLLRVGRGGETIESVRIASVDPE